jgi:hypothetical protein
MTEAPPDRSARFRLDAARIFAAAVFAAFLLYYGLCAFAVRWGGDFQMYCAGVAALYRDFQTPFHEAMDVSGSQSTVYTPYLVLVAAIGKLCGSSPYRALQVAGLVNLGLYLVAIRYFVSRTSMHRHTALAAACFLLVTLFLRWGHFGWSSETSVVTMQWVQAYPSTIAWAMAFFAFGLVEDLRAARRRRTLVMLAAVLWFLLLTHVITATWVIGMVGLRGLYVFAGDRDWRFAALLAGAVAAAVAVAALWPYSSFFGQGSMTEVREPSRFGRNPFLDMLGLYLVAVPAAVWLVVRVRRHAFMVMGFAATFAALELWRLLGISFGNRYSFFMAFFAQFLVAEAVAAGALAVAGALDHERTELPAERPRPRIDRPVAIILLVAAALAWLPSPMWGKARSDRTSRLASPAALWRRPSPHDAYHAQLGGLAAALRPGDVVLMPLSRAAFDVASLTGARVVSAPNAHRVPDARARERDVNLYFSDRATPAQRLEIAVRYCATRVLLVRPKPPLLRALQQQLGAPMYRDRAHVLFDVSASVRGPCTATVDER